MGICDMNQDTAYVITLNKDSSISTILLDEFDPSKVESAKYILYPNYRDSNYFIVRNSEFVTLKHAKITYGMMMDYIDREFCDDGYDPRVEDDGIDTCEVEVTTAYEFFVALWNIFYFRAFSELMYRGDVENYDMIVFTIAAIAIDVTLADGSVVSFEWNDNPSISAVSNLIKLMTGICDAFKIPHRKFRRGELNLRIEDNQWEFVLEKDIKKRDMIGYISRSALTVRFYSRNDIIWSIANQMIDIEYTIVDTGPLSEFAEFYDLNNHLADGHWLNNSLYIFDFPNIVLNGSFILSAFDDDKMTLLSNMKSFIHYMEGCARVHVEKGDGVIGVVTMGFHFSKNDKRRNVNMTREYISFL